MGFLILILLIVGAVLAYRWYAGEERSRSYQGGSRPLQIAKERYAKGEITKEEYERIRNDLEQ